MNAVDKITAVIQEFHETYGPDGDPAKLAGEIVATLGGDAPYHVIEIGSTGWTIQHPLDCRGAMLDCPVQRASVHLSLFPAPSGRYMCAVDPREGKLVIGKRITEPAE